MNGQMWQTVILEWVNCLQLTKVQEKTQDLKDGTFFTNFLNALIGKPSASADCLEEIIKLLRPHYPKLDFSRYDITLRILTDFDIVFILSLLLHYSCILKPKQSLISPLCCTLPQSSQTSVKNFLERMHTTVSNDDLKMIFDQSLAKTAQLGHEKEPLVCGSPLHAFLKTPHAKKKRFSETEREIVRLKTVLDWERCDKTDIQEQYDQQQKQIAAFREQLSEKSSLISKLRSEIAALECASLEDSKSDALEEHHRLRNEIESLDQYIKDLHSDKEQLYNETDILRDKLKEAKVACSSWQEKAMAAQQDVDVITVQYNQREIELENLRSHCNELSVLLGELRESKNLNQSAVEADNSLPYTHLDKTFSAENLASTVIEVQLMDSQKENYELRDLLNLAQENASTLTQKLETVKAKLSKIEYQHELLKANNEELLKKASLLSETQNALDIVQNELSVSTTKVKELTECNTRLKTEITTTSQNLNLFKEESEKINLQLTNSLKQLETSYLELEETLVKTNQNCHILEQNANDISLKYNELTAKYEYTSCELQTVKKQYDDLNDGFENGLRKFSELLSCDTFDNEDHASSFVSLLQMLEVEKEQFEEVTTNLKERESLLLSEKSELCQTLALARSKIHDLESANMLRDKEVHDLTLKTCDMTETIKSYENELLNCRNSVKQKVEELRDVTMQLKGVEKELSNANEEILQCKLKQESLQSVIFEKEKLHVEEVKCLNEQIQKHQNQLRAYEIDLENSKSVCSTMSDELDKIQSSKSILEETQQKLKEHISTLERKQTELVDALATTTSEKNDVKQALVSLQQLCGSLQIKLEHKEAEYKILEEQADDLIKRLELKKEECLEKDSVMSKTNQELLSVKLDLQEKCSALELLHVSNNEKTKLLEGMNTDILVLSEDKKNLNKTVCDLQDEVQRNVKVIDSLQENQICIIKISSELSAEKDQLQNEVQQHIAYKNEVKQELASLHQICGSLQTKLEHKEAEYKILEEQAEDLIKRLELKKEECLEKDSVMSKTNQELLGVKLDLQEKCSALELLHVSINEKTKLLEGMNTEILVLSEDKKNLNKTICDLQDEVQRNVKVIDSLQENQICISKISSELSAEKDQLQNEVQQHIAYKNEVKQELVSLHQICGSLQTKLEHKEADYKILEEQAEDLIKRLVLKTEECLEKDSVVSKTNQELLSVKLDLQEKCSDLELLHVSNNEKTKLLEGMKTEILVLSEDKKNLNKTICDLQDEAQRNVKVIDSLQENQICISKISSELSAEKDQLQNEMQQHIAYKNEAESTVANLTSALADSDGRIGTLMEEKNAVVADNQQQSAKISELMDTIQTLNEEQLQLLSDIHDTKTELSNAVDEYTELLQNHQELKIDHESQVNGLTENLHNLIEKYNHLDETHKDTLLSLKDTQEALPKLQSELEKQEQEKMEALHLMTTVQEELRVLDIKKLELDSELETEKESHIKTSNVLVATQEKLQALVEWKLELESVLKDQDAEKGRVLNSLTTVQEKMEGLAQQKLQLEHELETHLIEKSQTLDSLEIAEKNLQVLRTENSSQKLDLEMNKMKLDETSALLAAAQSNLQVSDEKVLKLETELRTEKEENMELTSSLSAVQNKLQALSDKKLELESELDVQNERKMNSLSLMQEKLQMLDESRFQLESELDFQKTEKTETLNLLKIAQEKLQDLDKETIRLQSELSSQTAEQNQTKDSLTAAQTKLQELDEENLKLKTVSEAQQIELLDTVQLLTVTQDKLQTLREEKLELEAEFLSQKSEKDEILLSLKIAQEKLQEVDTEKLKLQSELNARQAENVEAVNSLCSAQDNLKMLDEKKLELETELETQKAETIESLRSLNVLQDQLHVLEGEKRDLESKIDSYMAEKVSLLEKLDQVQECSSQLQMKFDDYARESEDKFNQFYVKLSGENAQYTLLLAEREAKEKSVLLEKDAEVKHVRDQLAEAIAREEGLLDIIKRKDEDLCFKADDAKKIVDNYQQNISKANSEIENLRDMIKQNECDMSENMDKIMALENDKQRLAMELVKLGEQMNSNIASVDDERGSLIKSLEAELSCKAGLERKVTELEDERCKFVLEHSDMKGIVESISQVLKGKPVTFDIKPLDLGQLNIILTDIYAQINEIIDKQGSVTASVPLLTQEDGEPAVGCDILCKEMTANLATSVDKLLTERKSFESAMDTLNRNFINLQKKTSHISDETAPKKLSEQRQAFEIIVDDVQKQFLRISRGINETVLQAFKSPREFSNNTNLIGEQLDKIGDLKFRINEMVEQFATFESTFSNVICKPSSVQKENVLRSSNAENTDKIKDLDLKKKNIELKQRLTLVENAKNNLEKRIKQLREDNKKQPVNTNDLLEENGKVKEEINQLKSKYDSLLADCNDFKNRNNFLNEQLLSSKCLVTENDSKVEIELTKLRSAYTNVMTDNSNLRLENTTMRKLLEDRTSKLSEVAVVKEAYEKLLEENNKLMMELDTQKYKRNRDREAIMEVRHKDSKKILDIKNDYDSKLEKMRTTLISMYKGEVEKQVEDREKEIQKNMLLLREKEEVWSNLRAARSTIQRLEQQLNAGTRKVDAEDSLFLVPSRDTSVLRSANTNGHLNSSIRSTRSVSTNHTTYLDAKSQDERRFTMPRSMNAAPVPVDPLTKRNTLSSVPHNIGRSIQMEDEEEQFNNKYLADLKEGRCVVPISKESDVHRLSELQWRNSLCLPHLKSSYPAETQFNSPSQFREEEVKHPVATNFDDSINARLLPPEKRKKDIGTTSYKRPGPPTPSKNGGRVSLQGNELQPREALKDHNERVTPKKPTTPSRFLNLFMGRNNSENQPGTPKAKRLSIFRRQK